MNIGRNAVNEFSYSSSMPATNQAIFSVGTANNNAKNIRITDLKMSCGATARTVKIYCSAYSSAGKALEFDIATSAIVDMSWQIPYKFYIKGSTGEHRNLYASATGTGVKYTVSGYSEEA